MWEFDAFLSVLCEHAVNVDSQLGKDVVFGSSSAFLK